MANALDFLQSVAGFTQAQAGPQPRMRLATVDDGYDPGDFLDGTMPRVTFDGEATLSGKTYPVMGPYWPHPGDRVVMAPFPVGNTTKYVILGTLDAVANGYLGGNLRVGGNQTVTGDLTAGGSISGALNASNLTSGTVPLARFGLMPGWNPVASGTFSGSQVSISITSTAAPAGTFSMVRLNVVGSKNTGATLVYLRINSVSSSIYQTGRASINPSTAGISNTYDDPTADGFIAGFWTNSANRLNASEVLLLDTDTIDQPVHMLGLGVRLGSTPNVTPVSGRTTDNRQVTSLQFRAASNEVHGRYWVQGYIA